MPIYRQISEFLKGLIEDETLAKGDKLPGIKILAKTLGVNHLTVKEALRHLENENLIVLKSTRGTFIKDTSTSKLTVALILPNLNESSSKLSSGIQKGFSAKGSSVDIFHYDESSQLEIEQLSRLRSEGYDGAIHFPSLDPQTLKPLLEVLLSGFPLVFIDRYPAQIPCWSVLADNKAGGYLATRHLIEANCRRIACITSDLGGVNARYEGYVQAMREARIPVSFDLVKKVSQRDEHIEEIIEEWTNAAAFPDGIFFTNDFQAARGLKHIQNRGLKVPGDVRIVGFDDLSISNLVTPSLTTIHQDFVMIGERATQLLLDQIQSRREERFSTRHDVVDVSLVERAST